MVVRGVGFDDSPPSLGILITLDFQRASLFRNSFTRGCLQYLGNLVPYCARKGLETLENQLKTNQKKLSKTKQRSSSSPWPSSSSAGLSLVRPGLFPSLVCFVPS